MKPMNPSALLNAKILAEIIGNQPDQNPLDWLPAIITEFIAVMGLLGITDVGIDLKGEIPLPPVVPVASDPYPLIIDFDYRRIKTTINKLILTADIHHHVCYITTEKLDIKTTI